MNLSLAMTPRHGRSNSDVFEEEVDPADLYVPYSRHKVFNNESPEAFLAQELAKEPFNYKFNSASFHHLSRDEMLKVFSEILESIDPSQKIDPMQEEFEDIITRIFEFLRILGYRPTNISSEDLQFGIEDGDHVVLVPIMIWLMQRLDQLKSRAYLAKYLVKINIPFDLCADEDVVTAYDKYEKIVENFKTVHKEKMEMSNSKPVSKLIDEIQRHEREQTSLQRKTDALKSRVSTYPEMAEVIHKMKLGRPEFIKRDRLREEIKLEEQELTERLDRVKILQVQREEMFTKNRDMSPEQLLAREEEELESLVKDVSLRLPNKIRHTERKILAIQRTEALVLGGQLDIQGLRKRVHGERRRLEVIEADAVQQVEATEDLIFNRQRAKGIRAKRQELEFKVCELEEELETIRSDLAESQANSAGRIADQEAVRALTTAVRVRLGDFNKKKAEIRAIQAEGTTLASTRFILEQNYTESLNLLKAVEIQFGLEGYFEAKDQRENCSSGDHERKYQKIGDISLNIGQLMQKCKAQKNKIGPITKALNSLRQQVCLTTMTYNDMRKVYEKTKLKAECQFSQIRMKVDHLNREIERDELRFLQLRNDIVVLKVNLDRAQEEKVLYYGRSFRETLIGKIIEQERWGKRLREDESKLEEYAQENLKQHDYWINVSKLLQMKIKVVSGECQVVGTTTVDDVDIDLEVCDEAKPPEETQSN